MGRCLIATVRRLDSFGMHNNSNIPIEMIESDVPLTLLGYGLLTDLGGPGRRRGGLGLWREWRIDSALAQLSTNLDRFKFRPFGLAGGEAAAASALYLIRDGRRETLPSKVTNLMLRKGDIVRLETSGGGGFRRTDEAHRRACRARRATRICQPGGGSFQLRSSAHWDRVMKVRRPIGCLHPLPYFPPLPLAGAGGDEEAGLEGDFPAWNPGDVVMAAPGPERTSQPARRMSALRG